MAPNLTPNFEVKFLLHSDAVLNDAKDGLTEEVLLAFAILPTVTEISVMFLDDNDKTLYKAHWSPRIRRTDGKKGFELTYKRRYVIEGDDIDAALTAANADGFSAGDGSKYEAQVEWGYEKMTLSISRDKKASDEGISATAYGLPEIDPARDMLVKEAPDKFNDSDGENWGTEILKRARVYGPVHTKRYVGTFNHENRTEKITVEIWPIAIAGAGIEHVVEASFKADTRTGGEGTRRALRKLLEAKGWLSPRDSLKTQLIMDNY